MPTYTNLIILQGWFEVDSVQALPIDHMQGVVVKGWIYTTDHDGLEKFFGDCHPVVITGRPAEAVIEITRKMSEKHAQLSGINLIHLSEDLTDQSLLLANNTRPYVIAQGKLLTHDGQSCVDIKHISFLGLPWGALEALDELEPVMGPDFQAFVAALTLQEKHQLGQALGAAMRALIALRPTYLPAGQEG